MARACSAKASKSAAVDKSFAATIFPTESMIARRNISDSYGFEILFVLRLMSKFAARAGRINPDVE
jgi:hypothetical protein